MNDIFDSLQLNGVVSSRDNVIYQTSLDYSFTFALPVTTIVINVDVCTDFSTKI